MQHHQSCWCYKKPSGALWEKQAGKYTIEEALVANEHHRAQADPARRYEMESYLLYGCKTPGPVTARSQTLRPEQWVLLEELVKGLQPFECATVYFSGQESATAS